MNLLLDSNAFLWASSESPRLTAAAQAAIGNPANQRYLSIASVWELAIKAGTRRLGLADDLESFVHSELRRWRMELLPVDLPHIARVRDLPMHHRDPFDRLIIAQGQVESMPIVTSDRIFSRYGVEVIW